MNRRTLIATAAAAAAANVAEGATSHGAAQELQTVTQQLVDALAPGLKAVWAARLHPQFVSTDENGEVFTREQFLDSLRPLSAGASGTLRVTDFVARELGGVVIATYVLDEVEHYHGEDLRSKYRNTDSWVRTPQGWRLAAMQEIALRTDPPAITIPATEWDQYVGRYRLPDGLTFEIVRQGDGAAGRQGDGPANPLRAEAPDVLFMPGRPRYRYLFHRDAAGAVTGFVQRREAWDISWSRVA